MSDELITKIKDALKKRGIDAEKHFQNIKVETEEEVDNAVIDYAIELKATAAVDKRVQEALETQRKKLEKEALEKTKKNEPEPKTDQPNIQELIQNALKPILEKVNGLEEKTTKGDREKLIKAALAKEKIDDSWADTIIGNDETEITESITKIKSRLDAQKQALLDTELKKIGGNNGNGELGESIVTEIAKKNNESDAFRIPKLPGLNSE
jgi:hypothetical protein